MTVFWTILTTLTFSWIINEIYVNILIFVYGWTHNAPRIPKIYNITGIWWKHKQLLIVKPIAILRYTMKWNETRSAEALMIYDRLVDWLTDWPTDHMLKILSLPDWMTDQLLKIFSLPDRLNDWITSCQRCCHLLE